MMFQGVIRNCRLFGLEELADVGFSDGRIAGVGRDLGPAQESIDADGRLLLPGLVEVHTHLDKCFTLGRFENRSGTLGEAVARWMGARDSIAPADYRERAEAALRMASAWGVVALRTHVDVGDGVGLRALEAILDARSALRDELDVEIVALGPLEKPKRHWIREAIGAGADLVGGAPALMSDPRSAVELAVEVAGACGAALDLHVDESDDPATNTLGLLADAVLRTGFRHRVTASHCCSLAARTPEDARPIIEKVRAAGVSVVSLPSCNLVLQGRADIGPWRRGLTRVKELLAAEVEVAFGSDNVQDVFNPFGNFDPLLSAFIGAHGAHLTGREEMGTAVEMVSRRAAGILGRTEYGIRPGARADLVLLDARTPGAAIAAPGLPRAVWRRGIRSEASPVGSVNLGGV